MEAGYILEEECNREGHEIRESGRKYWDEKYRGHIDMLFNAIGDWFSAMAEDPLNKRFGEDWARLTRNLLFDSEGSLKLKPELWSDIRKVIVPTLVDKVSRTVITSTRTLPKWNPGWVHPYSTRGVYGRYA